MSISFGLIDHDFPLAAAADRPDWSRGFSRDAEGNFSSQAHIRELATTEVVGAAIAAAAIAGGAYLAVRLQQRLRSRRLPAEADADADVLPFRSRGQSSEVA